MGQIANALRALIENSEDLSTLPQLVAQVEALETSETSNLETIARLKDINKSYLAQIPIPNQQPEEEEEEEEPTLEDAKETLIELLKGDN